MQLDALEPLTKAEWQKFDGRLQTQVGFGPKSLFFFFINVVLMLGPLELAYIHEFIF